MMPRFGCRTQVRLELAMAQPRWLQGCLSSTERGPTPVFNDNNSTTKLMRVCETAEGGKDPD